MTELHLRWLRYFVAVAEELHFGRAAARMFVSQPTVSAQIRQLEAAVGAPLFVRTSRQVRLTGPGRRLLDDVRPALQQIDRAVEAVSDRPGQQTVAVAALPSLSTSVVPAFVRQHHRNRPEVRLELHQSGSARMLAGLVDHTFDVGLLWRFHDGDLPQPLACVPVRSVPLQVALPASHPMAGRDAVTILDLAREDWLVPAGPTTSIHEIDLRARCRTYGFVPSLRRDATNLHGMLAIVEARGGVCPVPPAAPLHDHTGLRTTRVLGERLTLAVVGHGTNRQTIQSTVDSLGAMAALDRPDTRRR